MTNTIKLIEQGKKATLESIELDVKSGDLECLYFASEKQINALVSKGKIDNDYYSIHQDYQEEMRCMTAEF
jgi:hypothetical protein